MPSEKKSSTASPSAVVDAPEENGRVLYLAGVTTGVAPDGHLLHSNQSTYGVRYPWFPFGDVESAAGEIGSVVDCAISVGPSGGTHAGTHVVAVDASGGLRRTLRERWSDVWLPFEDVKAQAGNAGDFTRVAAGRMVGELHVCGITADGLLWHTIRRDDGSWQPFFDIASEAGDLADPVGVACDGYQRGVSADGLQLFVVTADGRLWSSMRRQSDGHWTPFIDVKKPGRAGDPGRIVDVDCFASTADRQVYVTAMTDDGRLWFAVRREDTSWRKRLTDVEATAGEKGTFISTTTAEGVIVGATSDGGLWLTAWDPVSDTFLPFQDVTAEAGRSGPFTSLALDSVFFGG